MTNGPQPSVAHPLDDLAQLGTIGLDVAMQVREAEHPLSHR
jgi:hypothetical protein